MKTQLNRVGTDTLMRIEYSQREYFLFSVTYKLLQMRNFLDVC